MSSSVLYMSMSLDGYIAGPNDEPGNPAATASCGCTSGTSQTGVRPAIRSGRGAGRPAERDRDGAGGPAHRGTGRSLQR
jgi:hypothetical protein